MNAITETNAQETVNALDLKKIPLEDLAKLCAQMKNLLLQVQRREAAVRFRVNGTWVEFSDGSGSFRFPDRMQRAKLLTEISECLKYLEIQRKARTDQVLRNFGCHLQTVAYYANALTISFERIELRVLKGELSA